MQKNLNLCKILEENRLKGVYDSEQRLSSYLYDAGGERTLKMSGSYQSTYINSSLTISSVSMNDYTLYTSPYMVMTDNEYTKHYYVEADRVASKIGGGMANNITDINDVVIGFDMQTVNDYQNKANSIYDMMITDFEHLNVGVDVEVSFNLDYPLYGATNENGTEADLIYFFHKDHLGSSTQISDISANIIHHIEYMPYGETFVEQRSNWGTNYKFNGKELDEETGFYYYGARYYNPDISIWLSIDPLSDKYPSLSPYNYCANNPIKYVDPDGMKIVPTSEEEEAAYSAYRTLVFSDEKYKDVQLELTKLEEADEVFRIRMGDNKNNSAGGANFAYNKETGEFDININSWGDFSEMQKLSHELKHASQYLERKIGFNLTNGNSLHASPIAYDLYDEYEAFGRQNRFGKVETSMDKVYDMYKNKIPHFSRNETIDNISSRGYNFDAIKTLNKNYFEATQKPAILYHGWRKDIGR